MRSLFLFSLITAAVCSVPASASGPYCRSYYSSCYYPSYSYSTPYYAPTYYQDYAPAYQAPAAPVYSSDWRQEVIKYAAAVKEIEAFNTTMNVIAPGFAASHSTYYGGQAATLYGVNPAAVNPAAYSFKGVTTTENTGINLELADQRSARFNDNLRDTLGNANSLRSDLLRDAGDQNARVAEINARANAAALTIQNAANLLNSTGAAATSKTTTAIQGSGINPTTAVQVQGAIAVQPQQVQAAQPAGIAVTQTTTAVDPNKAAFLKNYARPACGQCHTPGPNQKGAFNVESATSLTRAQADTVWAHLTSDDPAKVMPKPEPGKPVKHLPPDHLMQWAAMLSQAQ